ncbi:MAG: hypothetical protein H6626_05395 [Pseudobdellovibrionaceae bacterium]|nr:MAG: hypothetical protein H6626_05395 [Pseudobdellovibrionaceae bacterium]
MSNDSSLKISNFLDSPLESGVQILAAEYYIPVFWLAMFTTEDLKTFWDIDNEVEVPYLATTVSRAIKTFEHRVSNLKKMFTNIDDYIPEWTQLQKKMTMNYVLVDLDDVLEMDEDGREQLLPALKAIDEPDVDSMVAFAKLTCFSDIFDQSSGTLNEVHNRPSVKEYLCGFER